MKNIFSNNHKKLTDKVFSRLMFTSIFGILLCAVCLCSATYAWFTQSISHSGNTIQSAGECLLAVTVDDGVNVIENVEGTLELEGGKTYRVTLSLPKNSSSGYVILSTNAESYYTNYIIKHDSDVEKTIFFDLVVTQTQNVDFDIHWGIYSGDCSVDNGGALEI